MKKKSLMSNPKKSIQRVNLSEQMVQNHLLNKKSEIKDMVLTPSTISKIVDISKKYLPSEESKAKKSTERKNLEENRSSLIKGKEVESEIRAVRVSRKIRRSELTKGYEFSKSEIELKRSNSEKTRKVNLNSLMVKFKKN